MSDRTYNPAGMNRDQPEFGRTWWGQAWLEALEQRARLDPNRLPRGRDYARGGSVGELIMAPGEVRAQVQGRKTHPYEVRIRVRRFTDDEWDRVLTAISARLGHAAALLDGELPPEIADDAAHAGLDLLPGGGEIGPRCTCPDDADPCKHAAAACYLITDALDVDPFVLLLLRGRTRDQIMAGVRTRRRGAASGRAGEPGATEVGQVGSGPQPSTKACGHPPTGASMPGQRSARGRRRCRSLLRRCHLGALGLRRHCRWIRRPQRAAFATTCWS